MSGLLPNWVDFSAQFPTGIEWLILLIIIAILLLFGPSKIPELARSIGKAWGEFKRGKMEVEREIKEELRKAEAAEKEMPETRIVRAAKELGIDVAAKNEDQLKLEISKVVKREERDKIIRAAKVLGINVEGVGVEELRKEILKAVA